MELKVKKLIPYLIGATVIFIILLLVLFGGNSDKSTTVSTPSSTQTSSTVEKSVEKTSESSSTSSSSMPASSSSTNTTSSSAETSSTSPSQATIITVENNSEFQTLLQSEDQSIITDFVQKYKGKTIEFDGNFADLAKVKSKYDILIHSGDYYPDEATGPNFKFIEINLISNPVFKPFNGENVRKGQNVHIKAKVGAYNATQDLIYLSPIEVSPR